MGGGGSGSGGTATNAAATAQRALELIEKMVDADMDHFLNHHMGALLVSSKKQPPQPFEPDVPEWLLRAAAAQSHQTSQRGLGRKSGSEFSPWIRQTIRETFVARKTAVILFVGIMQAIGVALLSAPFLAVNLYFLWFYDIPRESPAYDNHCLYEEFDPRFSYRLDMLLWIDTVSLLYTVAVAVVSAAFFVHVQQRTVDRQEREFLLRFAHSCLYLQHRLAEWLSLLYFVLFCVLFWRVASDCSSDLTRYCCACLVLRAFALCVYFVR